MTNPDYTAIAIVLDRSGSMARIKTDAEGGLNTLVDDQRKQPGRATLMLTQFDDQYEVVHGSKDIKDTPPVVIQPRGRTALLDAIGKTIADFGSELAAMPEDDRPAKVIVVIVTDGFENASHDWTYSTVADLIKSQREQWAWQFVFIGADQDAIAAAAQIGIDADSSIAFASTASGLRSMAGATSGYISDYRLSGKAAFSDADRDATSK
jgi:uncharacterized protein YegL